ncbi:MAG: hypothetical protein WCK65_15025 [Rhodospirillaceae bacterium]
MASSGIKVPVSGNATILIYLSLFLLLLVFFIVLSAHSVPRDYRMRAVLGSVEHSFPSSDGVARSPREGRGGVGAVAFAKLKLIGDLFETDVAIVKVDQVATGRLMVATMPADELFVDGSSFIRRERMGLLDRIAREIGEQGGVRFDVDFLVAFGPEPAGGVSAKKPPLGDPVARAAAMARALIADHAPPDALSVGIEPGESGTVRFLFSARNPAGGGHVAR